MVKTRHSGDIEVESPPKFLSLTNEKSRQSLNNSDAVGDSRQSGRGAYGETRDAYSIFEDRVVESRLRPRIGPSRAYNYLDVDSSDEEIIRKRRERHHPIHQNSPERRRSRYSRSRQIKQEMLDEQQEQPRRLSRRRSSLHEEMELSLEDEEGDDDNEDSRDTRSRRRGVVDDESAEKLNRGRSSNRRQHAVEDDPEDEKAARGRSTRRRQRPSREEDEERENLDDSGGRGSSSRQNRQRHTAEDDDDHLIRRSSRTRRQVYDTLNQSYLVSIPGRPKHDFDENNDHSDTKDQDTDDQEEYSDMYSRVKRKRVQVKRNMYGIPVNEDSDSDQEVTKRNKNNSKQDEEEEDDEENCDDEEEDEEGNEKGDNRRTTRRSMPLQKKQPQIVKAYSLREHKPQTNLYKAPVEEPRIKRIHHSIFAVTPTKKNNNQTYRSPAQRRNIRKRSALHSSSSSTSSSDSESNDEKSFKRRKAKSMAKARSRMMPMNFSTDAVLSASVIKDRVRSGASLADVEPMNIDRSVTFNSIGGLGKHIRALKEMVVFPLLYDKVFQRFKVDPPRGVLFYGPPGTGKTLVARALANECSQGDRRVAFFMRKGADCLSKWVGESERQLRLLFDQAYKFRPSIIFFDEIDGLAPVRSSRQDQIHSSIVSTLLALMDGLDSRGEIVVIGATNRIDSLDPALRRPGRFDREFLFPLPSLEARKQILKIHTASWSPKLNDNFISELAEKCVGYCGADLKALCTEAAMLALRRRYPQIYITNEALQLDVSSINVSAKDFFDAVSNIIPTSQRAVNTPARALTARVCPLLQRQLDKVMEQLSDTFPPCLAQTASLDAAVTTSQAEALAESGVMWDELASDEDEDAPSIFVPPTSSKGSKANRRSIDEGPNTSQTTPTYLNFTSYATSRPTTFRPRLMLVGREGQGQTTYIAPAVIHKMENLPVHVLDLPALYAVTAKTPEESCANVFHEAKRKCPSIIYLPYVNQWWDVMAETLRATLLTLIQDLDPTIPLLLLATSEQPYHTLDPVLQSLFSKVAGEVLHMSDPNMEERRMFFKDLLLRQACRPPPQKKQAGEILKLLKETKRQKPSFRMRRVKRKIREKSEVSSIYPFGANDENETEMCAEQVVDFEACKEKGVPSVAPSCKRKRPQRIRGEVLELKEDLTLTSGKQLASVTVKMTPKPVPMRPSVNSTHGMVLRSHGNHGKLNSNQSARESGQGYQPLVYTSSAPAPTLGHSQGDDFKKPSRPSGRDTQCSMSERRLRYLRRIGEINTNRGHSCVNSSPGHLQNERKHVSKAYRKSEFEQSKSHASLTDRHDRYLRRLRKLEARMAEAGPSDQAKSMTCDERNFLSARHLRYLRRLRKLDAMLGHTDCNSKCMLYDPDASSHEPGNLLKYKSSSVLSCGSLQMSYKTSTSSDGSTRKYNSELALPLNLRDLCSHRQSGVSSSCQSAHYKQKLTYALKGNKKAMSFPQRYNLRPKKNRGRTNDAQRMLEVLPKASAPKPRELTKEELELLVEKEELTLMELRIFLRDVLNKLGSDKKFSIFAKPVNIDDAPDYYEIIEHPMDLSTMMGKIDLHEYNTVRAFMDDIDLICSNALEYNPNRGPMDRVIRHRACALKDTAYAIIKTELDKDFEKTCVEIQESRKRRGEKSITVPNFYYTLPKNQPSSRVNNTVIPSYLQNPKPVRSIPKPEGERFSRRVRGLNSDPVPPLEAVEKLYRGARSGASPTRENKNNSNEDSGAGSSQQDCSTPQAESQSDHTYSARKTSTSVSKEDRGGEDSKSSEGNKSQQSLGTSSSKKRKNKCVWCRPRRKRPRLLSTKPQSGRGSGDEGGEDVSNEEEEEEDEEPTQELEKSSTKQLEVDTSEQEDLKSPRISTRNRSPALTSPPSRVATRRSSMSPHQGSSLASHSQGNTDQTEPKQDTVTPGTDQEGLSENRERKTDKKNSDSAQITGTQASLLGQMVSPPSEPVEKPSVVKRLDLDSVAVDSGVGSSVDSNGDSRDSMDHRGEGDSSLRATTVFTTTQDANQNCSTELKNRASAILNEPSQKIVVDNNRLTSLLNRLVARTDGYTVERLEKIYSHLSQIIYRHRHEYNKSGMVVDLERKVEELTKIVPSTSSTLQH